MDNVQSQKLIKGQGNFRQMTYGYIKFFKRYLFAKGQDKVNRYDKGSRKDIKSTCSR